MDQIKNVGVEVKEVDPSIDLSDIVELRKTIVLGLPGGVEGITRDLIERLNDEELVAWKEETIWTGERRRRVGILGGTAIHMALRFLSSTNGPDSMMWNYPQEESYFDYRQRIREEEVARGIRRPPKKAICSSRRRGRKFKG